MKEMTVAILLFLGLLYWPLVNSQSFPYVSFRGQTLANHSYVDLSLVGTSGSDSVQCITDLNTCCSGAQGIHRGDWYFPDYHCHPLLVISFCLVELRELTYVVETMLSHQLVSIAVIFQLVLSMMIIATQ